MAHPYHHAVSSSRIFGGAPEDYQAIHDWFDATKSVAADFRHRALRHHLEGVGMAIELFGESITNTDGGTVRVRDIGEQHLKEDCGFHPTVDDWMIGMERRPKPRHEPTVWEHCGMSAARWGGQTEDYAALHGFIDRFDGILPDGKGRALLHHSMGCFDAERRFGPTLEVSSGQLIPVRVLAEQHIKYEFGRVPTANAWISGITGQRWMVAAAGKHHPQVA